MTSMKALPLAGRALRRSAQCSSIGQSSRSITSISHRAIAQHGDLLSPCYTSSSPRPSPNNHHEIQKSFISTTPPRSVIGWIQDKLADRAKSQKDNKLVEHIDLMANTERWTIQMFQDEIDETLNTWTAKLPGASKTTEVAAAKATQEVVKAMVDHLGGDVTADEIGKLDRKDKLKLIIACQKPADELNRVLDSFKQMNIMHRILRYRKEKGIALPTTEDGLQMAMQQDGIKVMTKAEKAEMRELFSKM